jgi:1-phosphatidylinositol phosphodiesterase
MRSLPAMLAVLVAAGCTVYDNGQGMSPASPGSSSAGLEFGIDRPGGDYRSFDLGVPRPEDCRDACLADPGCASFTYVNPGVQGPSARCWLKNNLMPAMANNCCVSGVKSTAGPTPGTPPPSAWQGAPVPQQQQPPPSAWQGAPVPQQQQQQAPAPASPPSAWQGRPTQQPPQPPGDGWEANTNRRGSDYRSFDLPQPRPDLCRDSCMREPQCVAFTYVNPGVQGPSARCWLKSQVPPPEPDGCCISGVK